MGMHGGKPLLDIGFVHGSERLAMLPGKPGFKGFQVATIGAQRVLRQTVFQPEGVNERVDAVRRGVGHRVRKVFLIRRRLDIHDYSKLLPAQTMPGHEKSSFSGTPGRPPDGRGAFLLNFYVAGPFAWFGGKPGQVKNEAAIVV